MNTKMKVILYFLLLAAMLWAFPSIALAEDEPLVPAGIVDAGVLHTCALQPSGAVDCWGSNDDGQADHQPGPYTQLSVGSFHTCGLTPAGAVECWGYNYDGQAGIHAGPYIQVSAGDAHTCALTPGGAVECWGDNWFGQAESQPGPYTQISAGERHTCALMPSGAVDCWGAINDDRGQAADQPGPYVQVSAGSYHTCALTPSGAVDCWGDNYYGQAEDQPGPYGPYIPSIVVTSDSDSGPGTLRQALADVGTGGTITFATDMTIHLASELDLTRDVIIDGGEHNVVISGDTTGDGTGDVRIFWVNDDVTASLKNVTLEKGYAFSPTVAYGGAIHNSSGTLTVTNVTFSSNSVHGQNGDLGGAIWNGSGGMLMVTNSTFSNNTLNNGGGGGIDNAGTLTVTNSTFSGNSAPYGGGIYNAGTLTVAESTFTGNKANEGGAIRNMSQLAVTNSTFSGNNASNYDGVGYGGAVSNDNRSGGEVTFSTSTFAANSAGTQGGAIYTNGSAQFTNNTFVGNTTLYSYFALDEGSTYFVGSGSLALYNNIISSDSIYACYAASPSALTGSNNLNNRGCGSSISYHNYLPGRIFSGSTSPSSLLLGPLGSNGGSTQTFALLPGSPAIDAGDSTSCPATDQRGLPRVGACDIGAFESQGFSLAITGGDGQSALVNTAFAQPLQVSLSSPSGEPVDGGRVSFTAPASGASTALTGSPATISGGIVSVNATANGTAGSYNVTASANGATSVIFALTNHLPQPVLDAISPASAIAGSADLTLSVTGSSFMSSSVIRWNGADLATTYVNDTQLTATIPAANLGSVQTAQVTVYTPYGGTSPTLVFFVTQAAANVTGQDVASGTDPSAAAGSSTAAASGDGLLAVAQYDDNPGGTPSFTASGMYFDVYAAPDNTFSQVTIVACGMSPNDKLFWWDLAAGQWQKASPQSFADGCITLTVTDTSSPSLSQLQGTFFAAGVEPNTPPTANPGGPYLAAINTALSFDGGLSSDPDGDLLTFAWTFDDGSTGTGAQPTHIYAAAGIYDVCLTVNDATVDSAPGCTIAVVYDPSAGFVTGGGWIDSPAGAYKPDINLSGKATFGFVSRYQKGASLPAGTTEFMFQAGAVSFTSTAYEWLVVDKGGKTAQFKGSGTVNGVLAPNGKAYKFQVWAGDGTGLNGADTFRIKIWWEDASGEQVVYDNGASQPIGGGSIIVHISG